MNTTSPIGRPSGLGLFLAVTFTTSWASWLVAIWLGGSSTSSPTVLPYLFGAFGPSIGALAVRAHRARRGHPVPEHTVRLRLGLRLFWVAPLLLVTSATVLAGVLAANLLGGPAVSLPEAQDVIRTAGGPAAFLVGMLIGGPLAEEPGWRGTAHPRLRASLGRYQVGLVLGAIWAVWHLPLFFIDGTVHATFGLASWSGLLFMLSAVPMSLLAGYAYDRAGVPGAIAVHFAANSSLLLLGVDSPGAQLLVMAVQTVVALALLATERSGRKPRSQPEFPPGQLATESMDQVHRARV
ncbi:lysostaphin resistance A-like protein [Streptomyces sp. NPDC096310]|uniref:CPBP family intramembrane glutamic endopeptidase n=1 Tax=Streptomyces sp. NPDC096310 TaxID=3366082 RepID=UPI003803D540